MPPPPPRHRGGVGVTPPPSRYGPGMPPPPRRRYYGGPAVPPPPPRSGYRRRSYGPGCGGIVVIFIFLLICFIISAFGSCFDAISGGSSSSSTASTIERRALTDVPSFDKKCVEDELGWLDSESGTASELKYFYEKTGIQPYVILKEYDESLVTDKDCEDWAEEYYDDNLDEENVLLFVYFDTGDDEIGAMTLDFGKRTMSVMDSEAEEIFWNHMDDNWFNESYSMDEVIYKTFNETADVIMASTTAKYKTISVVIGCVAVIVLFFGAFMWWKKREERKKEEAAETERILNTPMENLVTQELEKQYKDM